MKLKQTDKRIFTQAILNGYHGQEGPENWTDYEKKSAEWWDVKENEGFTAIYNHEEYGKILIVLEQGTRSKQDKGRDWGFNFDTKQIRKIMIGEREMVIPYGNMESEIRMHRGVVRLYNYVRDDIRYKISKALNKGYLIWLCGHSLGGSLTKNGYIDTHHMFTDEMGMKQKEVEKVLTAYAAAPYKIGNRAFYESLNKRANGNVYEEWYGNDTVPDFPTWIMGYPIHGDNWKRYANLFTNIQAPFTHLLKLLTFGMIPSIGPHDHYPMKLDAAVDGRKIPTWIECAKYSKK